MSLFLTIKNRYGSKKGLLRYLTYKVLYALGGYHLKKNLDLSKVKRMVFVCQGNICRSPLGEAIAIQNGISATSFGMNTRGGDQADSRAIGWAAANGFELGSHITRRVDQYEPLEGDLLIGMEPKHIQLLSKRFSNAPVQITLLGLWFKEPLVYLHDPYNSNEQYFSRCEHIVADSTKALLHVLNSERIKTALNLPALYKS